MAPPNMLLALSVTIAAVVLLPTGSSALAIPSGQQQSCCTPDQWEAGLGYVMVGSPPYNSGYGRTSFDYTNQLLAVNQTFLGAGNSKYQHRLLMNGKTRKMYTLDLTTGRCTTSSMPSGVPRQCVPPTLKYTQSISLGDSSGQLSGLIFQGDLSGNNFTLVMTKKQCAPVFEVARIGANQMIVESFYNFTTGIKDRSVFSIPPGCKAAEGLHGTGGDAVAAVLMRQLRSLQAVPCTSMFSPCWMAK